MEKNLQIYRGDDKNYNFVFKDGDGSPIDITGWILFFTVKSTVDDAINDDAAEVIKTISAHTNPAEGQTTVSILDTDTNGLSAGDYYYDFQVKKSTGKIMTIMHGGLEITREVTRRIS